MTMEDIDEHNEFKEIVLNNYYTLPKVKSLEFLNI